MDADMDAGSTFKIKFAKNRPDVPVDSGKNLMQNLLDAGIPVASSCRGDGVCARCRIQVTEGLENLSKPNPTEVYLRDRHSFEKNERISCQVQVTGDIKIDTPYW